VVDHAETVTQNKQPMKSNTPEDRIWGQTGAEIQIASFESAAFKKQLLSFIRAGTRC